jgi:RNase adaptor protein for sRNA GlmZ degradation
LVSEGREQERKILDNIFSFSDDIINTLKLIIGELKKVISRLLVI